MNESGKIIQIGRIQQRILEIRGVKTIVDADLAKFYGVETKGLNEQVRRNPERFPDDFMFNLQKLRRLRWSQNATTSLTLNIPVTYLTHSLNTEQSWLHLYSTQNEQQRLVFLW